MAIEDAVVLGTLFSHLCVSEQVPAFLQAYQELREARTAVIKDEEIKNALSLALPPGQKRAARDASLKPWVPEDNAVSDEEKINELESSARFFRYNAADVAEEWWINWGQFLRSEDTSCNSHLRLRFDFLVVS